MVESLEEDDRINAITQRLVEESVLTDVERDAGRGCAATE